VPSKPSRISNPTIRSTTSAAGHIHQDTRNRSKCAGAVVRAGDCGVTLEGYGAPPLPGAAGWQGECRPPPHE
jgi:hypothetical protein